MYNGSGKEKNNKNKNKTRLITKSDLITFKNAEVSFPKSNRKHLESNFWFWTSFPPFPVLETVRWNCVTVTHDKPKINMLPHFWLTHAVFYSELRCCSTRWDLVALRLRS